ncbi:MAG: hypothetical protein ACYDGR_09490 [Candidatus Dormibacteria bacterium]
MSRILRLLLPLAVVAALGFDAVFAYALVMQPRAGGRSAALSGGVGSRAGSAARVSQAGDQAQSGGAPSSPGGSYTPAAGFFEGALPTPAGASAAEPTIKDDAMGNAFVIAPTGTPSGGCATWQVSRLDQIRFLGYPEAAGTSNSVGGGGDCDLGVDTNFVNAHAGAAAAQSQGAVQDQALYYSSMGPGTNFYVGASQDRGQTWTVNPAGVDGPPLVDRQWSAVDHKGWVYMAYHFIPATAAAGAGPCCPTAVTKGFMGQAYHLLGYEDLGATSSETLDPYSKLGPLVFDPTSVNDPNDPAGLKDRLYSISTRGASGAENRLVLGVSDGSATGCSAPGTPCVAGRDWTFKTIYRGTPTDNFSNIFPALAVDSAGTLYAAWSDSSFIYYTYSRDHGDHWTDPFPVSLFSSDSTIAHTIMPWLVAGTPGRVGLAWYATSGASVQKAAASRTDNWVVEYASSSNADTSNFRFDVVQASTGPVHRGAICTLGAACGVAGGTEDRTVLDFLSADINALTGGVDLSWGDDSAAKGISVPHFARQVCGSSLLDTQARSGNLLSPAGLPLPTSGMPTCAPEVTSIALPGVTLGRPSYVPPATVAHPFSRVPDAVAAPSQPTPPALPPVINHVKRKPPVCATVPLANEPASPTSISIQHICGHLAVTDAISAHRDAAFVNLSRSPLAAVAAIICLVFVAVSTARFIINSRG